MQESIYAFDLDGTITRKETLPVLAAALGVEAEMALLTRLTMEGKLDFQQSFKLRYCVLRNLPIGKIHDIMEEIPLDSAIEEFIKENRDACAIVTGNLDSWIEPIVRKLGCRCFSSCEIHRPEAFVPDICFVDKGAAVRELRIDAKRVVAVGEGANDIPMLAEADIAIGYGGIHKPADEVISLADYVVQDGEELCSILSSL